MQPFDPHQFLVNFHAMTLHDPRHFLVNFHAMTLQVTGMSWMLANHCQHQNRDDEVKCCNGATAIW
jgi:hypothetical protein